MLNAGRLRHRVEVQRKETEVDSDDGIVAEYWVNAFGRLLSADIKPLSGRELLAAHAVSSRVSTRIVMRYRRDVTAEMRVLHRDTIYAIDAVVPDPDSGRRWMTLQCSSGVNEG